MTTHRFLATAAFLLFIGFANIASAQSPAWAEMFDQGETSAELKGISTPRGIKIEIVADGTAVGQPLGVAFGEGGELFVLQAKTDKAPERLIGLSDADADGRYEKSEVVMSDLAGRTKLFIDDGWFYLSGSGTVIRRRAHDAKLGAELQAAGEAGKGPPTSVTADQKWIEQTLVRGLADKPADQTGGLARGLDGSIYLSIGGMANRAASWDGSKATILGSGAIFCFRPDGSHVREFARGLASPAGAPLSDALGNMFQAERIAEGSRLIHVLEGGDYGSRSDIDPLRLDRPGTLPAMQHSQEGVPSGTVAYYGNSLPKFLQGLLMVSDPGAHAIRAHAIERDGNTFAVRQSFDFLRGDEKTIRPTRIMIGPEGAFYVVDARPGDASRILRFTWSGTKAVPAIETPLLAKHEPAKSLSPAESLAVAMNKTKSATERAAALGDACRAWDKTVHEGCLSMFLDDEQPDLQRLAADAIGEHLPADAESQEQIADAMEQKLLLGALPVRRSIYIALGKLATKVDSVPEWIFEATSVTPDVHTNRYLFDGHVRAAEVPKGWATELMLGNLEVALFDPNPEPQERQRLKLFVVTTAEAMRTRELADFIDKSILDEKDYFSKLDGPLQVRLLSAYQNVLVEPAIQADAVARWLEKHPAAAAEVQLAAWQTLARVSLSKPELVIPPGKALLTSEQLDPALKAQVIAALSRHRTAENGIEMDKLLEAVKRIADKAN